MNAADVFRLKPFAEETAPPIAIAGEIARQNNTVSIQYHLQGPLEQLIIPEPMTPPLRRYELWETTCFEFFLAEVGALNYWEFNLSPSGNWNVFRLTDYRENLTEELAIASLPFRVEQYADALHLNLGVDLAPLFPQAPVLEVGITTVIQAENGQISYWALTHCGREADFHRRESFVIQI
jgi:hypothetical protein